MQQKRENVYFLSPINLIIFHRVLYGLSDMRKPYVSIAEEALFPCSILLFMAQANQPQTAEMNSNWTSENLLKETFMLIIILRLPSASFAPDLIQ